MITTREYQIAELITWGQSEKDIAQRLYLSCDTVKTHKKNLMRKIQAHNIADVTRWFITKTANITLTKSQFARQVISILLLSLTLFDMTAETEFFKLNRNSRRTECRVKTRRKYD